jgi:hypothetical protein
MSWQNYHRYGTLRTLRAWIEECKEAGVAEMKRREHVEGPERHDGTEDVPASEHVETFTKKIDIFSCQIHIEWTALKETSKPS